MAIEVLMPKFGLTMHEATVKNFFKKVGDKVAAGEPLFEIETEKVLYQVEAPGDGTVAAILCSIEDTVECGKVVMILAETGESVSALAERYAQSTEQAAPTPIRRSDDVSGPNSSGAGRNAEAAATRSTAAEMAIASSSERRRVVASPVARKLAAELGLDLGAIAGTGPGGRITRADVEAAASRPQRSPVAPASDDRLARHSAAGVRSSTDAALAQTSEPAAAEVVPMRGMRRTIAERMMRSLRETAQLTLTHEADITAAVELHERLKTRFEFTYTDMAIQAAARALRRFRRLNSVLTPAGIELLGEINIGFAVALEDGLIVPVIRSADRLTLAEIATASRALAEKARANRLTPTDVSGGTFTVTNLGTYGVDAFTPILNPGQTAILGLGRIVEKPRVWHGEITKRWTWMLSLTFDHRIVDGAPAAQFLQAVVEILNYGER